MKNTNFSGREHEFEILQDEYNKDSASLVVMYGRRRVGKSRLITEFYKDKNLWRFDGLEKEPKAKQIRSILDQLSKITKNSVYASAQVKTWLDCLKLVNEALATQKHRATLFLDEVPYMANRQPELISALKWAWDNLWQDKLHFTLVLCGSIASFMIENIIKSSALYGRITLEICLKPLSLPESWRFFENFSLQEMTQLYMTCGGIPEYLKQFSKTEPLPHSIAKLAFNKDGYFTGEFDRLFKDVLLEENIYKKIIIDLSKYRNLKIPEIVEDLGISSGGGVSDYLSNLESAGFVASIIPWDRPNDSKIRRYRLDDEYLHFYFKFIYSNLRQIRNNTSIQSGMALLNSRAYSSWAGLAFERLCLKHTSWITKTLHIDQLVQASGPYFRRTDNTREGVQIDLMFVRHDPVITICEMKYYEGLVGKNIISEVERKVNLLDKSSKRVEKVLITTLGATQDLIDTHYFSRILTLNDIFKK